MRGVIIVLEMGVRIQSEQNHCKDIRALHSCLRWIGVLIGHNDYVYRIDHLRKTKAHVKFLSIEPLLGPLHDLNLEGIDWVIVGGESGPGARPVEPEWVVDILKQCKRSGTPFFFKQWGGVHKKKAGRELEGRTWDQMPERFYTPLRPSERGIF